MRAVNLAWRSRQELPEVEAWVSGSLVDTLRRAGFQVQSVTKTAQSGGVDGTEWVLMHEARSSGWLLISWIAWWWSTKQYWAVLSLSPLSDGRTELIVAGDLPGQVAKILRQLPQGS